jgi:hypothetical protein
MAVVLLLLALPDFAQQTVAPKVELFAQGLTLSESTLSQSRGKRIRTVEMKNSVGSYLLVCHLLADNGEENPGCAAPKLGVRYDLYTTNDGPYPENNVGLVQSANHKVLGLYYLISVTAKAGK